MSVVSSTTGKTPSSTVGRRVSSATKGGLRMNRSQGSHTSQSLRISNVSQQINSSGYPQKSINEMNNNNNNTNLLAPPRPPDPTLFIRAGTSGVRHLFPIHLNDNDCNGGIFSRPISHLRSRTPTSEFCTNIEMIRNICLSIKTLQHFDVSQNELNDLPLDICLLIELETLNCSHNQLIDISDLFEKLKRLKELDLSFNLFKFLPNVIYTFKSLIRLNCEHNFIKIIEKNLII